MIRQAVETIQTVVEKINPGDWFFAMTIKGEDGHLKIARAIERGATCITTEVGREAQVAAQIPNGFAHEVVHDLREALFARAAEKRAGLRAQFAVVAGSNGKTTVKEMIVSVLKASHTESGKSFGFNPENQNTKIGLATALLRLPADAEYAVFEVGARHVGDFATPLAMLQPDVVALLNVGTAHLGEFGSLENLRSEKLSILAAPSAKTLIVPANDESICNFARRREKKVVTFMADHSPFVYQAPASDLNFGAARAICESLGLPDDAIERGLANFRGVPRRFQEIQIRKSRLIDDAFNASPESSRAGLEKVAHKFPDQKILLVLGSMLELGAESKKAHQEIGALLLSHPILRKASVITVGDAAKAIDPGAPNFATADLARDDIQNSIDSYDVIYFKASRSIGFEKLIQELH